jgi:hypothetical protein
LHKYHQTRTTIAELRLLVTSWFVSSNCNKICRHDIAEILLKVALNTKNQSINKICQTIQKNTAQTRTNSLETTVRNHQSIRVRIIIITEGITKLEILISLIFFQKKTRTHQNVCSIGNDMQGPFILQWYNLSLIFILFFLK